MTSSISTEPEQNLSKIKRLNEKLKDFRELFDNAKALIASISGLLGALGFVGGYLFGSHSQPSSQPQTLITRLVTAPPAVLESPASTATGQSISNPGGAASNTASATPSIQSITYLSEMTPADPTVLDGGSWTVNGSALANSYGNGLLENGSADFNLGRKFKRFQAVVGLSDDSPVDELVEFKVYLDGRVAYDKSLQLGTSDALSIDVSGVFRLSISAVAKYMTYPGNAVWGDARLS